MINIYIYLYGNISASITWWGWGRRTVGTDLPWDALDHFDLAVLPELVLWNMFSIRHLHLLPRQTCSESPRHEISATGNRVYFFALCCVLIYDSLMRPCRVSLAPAWLPAVVSSVPGPHCAQCAQAYSAHCAPRQGIVMAMATKCVAGPCVG